VVLCFGKSSIGYSVPGSPLFISPRGYGKLHFSPYLHFLLHVCSYYFGLALFTYSPQKHFIIIPFCQSQWINGFHEFMGFEGLSIILEGGKDLGG